MRVVTHPPVIMMEIGVLALALLPYNFEPYNRNINISPGYAGVFNATSIVMSLPPPVASENNGGLKRMDEPCTTGRVLISSIGTGSKVKLMAPEPLVARLFGAKLRTDDR